MRLFAVTRGFDALQNLHKQRHVPIDQIKPGFFGFSAQPCGDQENVAIRRASIITCIDFVVSRQGAAVMKVQRLALRQVLVGIEDLDLRDQCAALQSISHARTHTTPAADHSNFHKTKPRMNLMDTNKHAS